MRASTSRSSGDLALEHLDAGRDVARLVLESEESQALLALHDGSHRAVLGLDHLGDLGQGADAVELVEALDVLSLGLTLGHERDERIAAHGHVEGLDRLVSAHLQGHDHLREDDGLAQGHERQHSHAGRELLARFARGRGCARGVSGLLAGHSDLLGGPVGCLVAPPRGAARSGIRCGLIGLVLVGTPDGFGFAVQLLEETHTGALLELE